VYHHKGAVPDVDCKERGMIYHLLYPPFNLIVSDIGVDLYGNQKVDHYTHVHNYCFHVKLCEVFDKTPLPVTGSTGFLTKGFFFSLFMRNK